MKLSKVLLTGALLISSVSVFGQNTKKINFDAQEVTAQDLAGLGDFQINTTEAKYYQLDIQPLYSALEGIAHREVSGSGFTAELNFPHPDGTVNTYHAKANNTMHPDLAARYPMIKSFDANGDGGSFVKWDITQHGFHAMIMRPGKGTIYIDPIIRGNTEYYIVYLKENFITDKQKDCEFNSDVEELINAKEPVSGVQMTFGSCELRTYRLALAATGEYTIFQGGTVADAQAAQVTTMNRVNGVYEQDMAITMTLIANNDQLIYTSTGGDPYTNGNAGSMIGQNQSNVTAVIGSANYDIGHVFGTNSGGLAGLGVVCSNSNKARGVTGSSSPNGDSFDIDYVAHEMGHQFGCNHTFNNSCSGNRNNSTAMEPGSGSSIMAYAGICTPNVQNNSDDHFHGISLEEMGDEILSSGHQCEVITPLANIAPVITSTNGGTTVPGGTPFALTAVVTDPDGDPLTYNWEQMDNGISTQPPVSTSNLGPNFRSYPSNSDATRYFPRLQAVANNGPFTWERLSDVSRTMNFRVVVRDNSGPGGCNDHDDVTVTVDGNSGPFLVLYPSVLGIVWTGGTNRTVTWDVANTDVAPVNCSTVDIFLSTDNGLTYPTTLATGVPNDGAETIAVPNISDLACRIMVMNSAGTFFDVSDKRFEIQMGFAGLEEGINESVAIFPNPTSGELTVSWKENAHFIEITDAMGKVLDRIDVENINETFINLSEYSNGVYFIHVNSDEGTSVHNIVKQ